MIRQIILLLLTVLFVCFPFPFVAFANGYVYVTNQGDDTVAVIDPVSNTVIDKIPVGSPGGIALDTEGKRAYVANNVENTVTVINTTSNSLAATVAVGSKPHCLTFDPVRNLIYVVNYEGDCVSVIDTNNNVLNTVISVGSAPWGITVDPAGEYVYVTNDDDNSVSVIDTEVQKVTATIHVGTGPLGIAVNPDGTKVYVANESDDTVSVIDTATNIVTHTINDAGGTGIAINPSGTEVWVAHGDDVLIIDNNEVIETISVGGGIDGIVFNSSGTRAYTASEYSNTVSVINTTTKDVIATIEDGIDSPFWIAVAPVDYTIDNVDAFITRFYQQCLSREPDTDGLDHWTDSLSNGDQAGADLAESFIFSEEFQDRNTSDSEFITILYNAFFDREPDTSGYNHWMDQLADGMSRSFVLDGFTSAQEFITLCDNYGIAPAFTDSELSEYIDLASSRYSVTEIRNLQDCGGPTSDYDYYDIINTQQDGCSVTFLDSEGIFGSGNLSGTSVTITSTWYEEGGTVDAVYNVTFAGDGSSFQGTGRATWADGYDSCQATSTISGTRY